MNWERTFEKYDEHWDDAGTEADPFEHLSDLTAVKGPDPAQIEVNAHRSCATDQGWMKCAVSVRLSCPQSEKHINMAGEVGFMKALELMNDGMGILVPGLEPIQA